MLGLLLACAKRSGKSTAHQSTVPAPNGAGTVENGWLVTGLLVLAFRVPVALSVLVVVAARDLLERFVVESLNSFEVLEGQIAVRCVFQGVQSFLGLLVPFLCVTLR